MNRNRYLLAPFQEALLQLYGGASLAAEIAGTADAAVREPTSPAERRALDQRRWRPGTMRRLQRRPGLPPHAAADALVCLASWQLLMDGAQDMELPTNQATGDDDQFVQQMSACRFLKRTQALLIQDGWTVQPFACCACPWKFDSDLHQLSLSEIEVAMAPMPGVLPFGFCLHLRWRLSQRLLRTHRGLTPFHPRFRAEVLGTLKKDFLSNFPAAFNVLPGPRMLAWLCRNLQGKQWRFYA